MCNFRDTVSDMASQPQERRGPAGQQAGGRDDSRAPWAGNPPLVDAARDRLLDAAGRCIARDGLAATSVASVATEAGVSRPTVYRYFDDRDELVGTAMHTAAERLRAQVLERIEPLDDAGDMVIEAIVIAVTEVPNDPVLRAIWSSAAVDASIVGTFTEPKAIEWARECLAPAIDTAGWHGREQDEVIEMILRLVLSLLVTSAPARRPAELRQFLRRRLLPGIGL
jgi:AcrR family transcriptional regulator